MADPWSGEDAARLARRLIHTAPEAALGTLGDGGGPHVSHVSAATMPDGAPLLLISRLARHTANLARDGRASLLYVAPMGGPGDNDARARVTLDGRMREVADRNDARDRFLRRHPAAKMYVDFSDFRFMAMAVEAVHLVAGFGRITAPAARDVTGPADLAATLAPVDASASAHMDADHADALALIAVRLAGGTAAGPWRSVGVDPGGIDIAADGEVVRAEWETPVGDADALRTALAAMAKTARGLPDGRAG